MGFGSYDESEQQNQEIETEDDSESLTAHENDHDGQVNFEMEESTNALVDRLADMKDDPDD